VPDMGHSRKRFRSWRTADFTDGTDNEAKLYVLGIRKIRVIRGSTFATAGGQAIDALTAWPSFVCVFRKDVQYRCTESASTSVGFPV